ncbi:HAMP domain-containing sensor histidine kinase [Verrucomicrobiaceae bacterium 227]
MSSSKMRRPHFSVSAKILICLTLNVLTLILGGILFVSQRSGGLGFITEAVTTARVQDFASEIKEALESRPEGEWTMVLQQFGDDREVALGLFTDSQRWLAGPLERVPEALGEGELQSSRNDERPSPPPRPDPSPAFSEANNGLAIEGPYRLDFAKSEDGSMEWIRIKLPLRVASGGSAPGYLLVESKGRKSDLFFQSWLWITAAVVAILGSVVIWAPLMLSIGTRLRGLSRATNRIADGELGTRVSEDGRTDEISRLSQSVNRMAGSLERHSDSQKRFLGDIAHELSSPIARMQAAISLLENNLKPSGDRYLQKVDDQLQHMSALVNELLLFSKASHQNQPKREPIQLADAVEAALAHELGQEPSVHCDIPPGCSVLAVPAFLERAIANVVRNSLRYAGTEQAIEVIAKIESDSVVLRLLDSGPGVSGEALPNLFDAFYRPDPGRHSESGGTGLGLAIVKACIESCGGRVSARNRVPQGFEIRFVLERG